MKRLMLLGSVAISLLMLGACSSQEDKYQGAELDIGVIGELSNDHLDKMIDVGNHNLMLTTMSTMAEVEDNSHLFDAILIMPEAFEEASNDKYLALYEEMETPVIFFDSEKRHFPFVNGGVTYETAHWDSLVDGSHSTVYVSNAEENRTDAWHFYLENEKELDKLLKELFEKVGSL